MFYKSLLISLLTTFLTISACSNSDKSDITASSQIPLLQTSVIPTLTATPIPPTATPNAARVSSLWQWNPKCRGGDAPLKRERRSWVEFRV